MLSSFYRGWRGFGEREAGLRRSGPAKSRLSQSAGPAYHSSNRHGVPPYQWVSQSSTKSVDKPVEKVFDTGVNAAVSLVFLRFD
jgi:hypothetical protein